MRVVAVGVPYSVFVTLNLTVVHSRCVYVAADFALVDMDSQVPLTEPSMKVVQLGYENGATGLITSMPAAVVALMSGRPNPTVRPPLSGRTVFGR